MGKIFALLVLFLTLSVSAEAATRYVSTTGSDSNNCTTSQTIGTPKRNLNGVNGALACLVAGDTLFVRTGTYDEGINLNTVASGTSWANKVRIASYMGETVTLKPTSTGVLSAGNQNSGFPILAYFGGTQHYIELDGINLDASLVVDLTIVRIEAGNPGWDAHHIRIQNAELIGSNALSGATNGAQGISEVDQDGTAIGGCEYRFLTMHEIGNTDFEHPMYLEFDNDIVENNHIYNSTGFGIHLFSGYTHQFSGTIVRNNTVHGGLTSGAGERHIGIGIADWADSVQVYNNVIYSLYSGDGGSIIGLYLYSSTNVKAYFNTIYGMSTGTGIGIQVAGYSENADIRNNVSYNNVTNYDDFSDGANVTGTTTGNNSFAGTNPLFVSTTGGSENFHLQVGSPLIGAGAATTTPAVTVDKDGVARAAGGYDIGAYEYTVVVPPPVASGGVVIQNSAANIHSCELAELYVYIQNELAAGRTNQRYEIGPGTCYWTYGTLPMPRGMLLIGAGAANTNIINASGSDYLLNLQRDGRITGFTFTCIGINVDTAANRSPTAPFGVTATELTQTRWRVDHNLFTCPGVSPNTGNFTTAVYSHGLVGGAEISGVVDHNVMHNVRTALVAGFTQATMAEQHTDTNWTKPLDLGTDRAVYFEHNTIEATIFMNVIDCDWAGSYVFRYNTVKDTYAEVHSATSGTGAFGRACRKWEIYENDITLTSVGVANGIFSRQFLMRGGTGVIYNNRGYTIGSAAWGTNNVVFDNHRSFDLATGMPLGWCNGSYPYDGNTAMEEGWPCLDQVGRGRDTVTIDTGVYPQQTSDPAYVWGNTISLNGAAAIATGAEVNYNPGSVPPDDGKSQNHIHAGRDYFVNVGAKPGYTALTDPHPLSSGDPSLPVPGLAGQGIPCDSGTVQAALNAAAGSNGTVTMGTCTVAWSSTITVPNGVTLKGSGTTTSITTSVYPMIQFDNDARVSNFAVGCGVIMATGTGWRIDHMTTSCSAWGTSITADATQQGDGKTVAITGLIDHNDITNGRVLLVPYAATSLIEMDGTQQWGTPLALGTNNAVFIEDNTFNTTSGGNAINAIDCNYGGRYVARHNHIYNQYVESHGVQGSHRGCRSWEIYDNDIHQTAAYCVGGPPACYRPIDMVGGTGVIFNNTVTGTWGFGPYVSFYNYRSGFSVGTYGNCNGASPYDGNSNGTGWPCLDQIGRGGDTTSAFDGTPPPYPVQTSEPTYVWNNTMNGSAMGVVVTTGGGAGQPGVDSPSHIQVNRDYFLSARPGYTIYTYPHPQSTVNP